MENQNNGNPDITPGQLLTDTEAEDLIISLAYSRSPNEFSELEAEKILDWANKARLDITLLDQVLVGDLAIDINKESEIVFKLTEQGKLVVEELMKVEKALHG